MKYEVNIEVKNGYDVIVVGSGPSGVAAAIMAGRNGAKTLLIESCGRVGGISTSGLMSHFTGWVGNKIFLEILNRASKKNHFPCDAINRIDPEMLTLTYIEMLEEAGVDTLLYTNVCDVLMEGDKIGSVI